ncbi:AAA family ATPase [Maribacter halichondriae]|uniref:AAA family ATPase n=1 Tax=Maribacter halichondriae TaxID=2980554 RepID=UPI002359BE26|nr:AAA family ATPase [Maribacter sp. Hal144]
MAKKNRIILVFGLPGSGKSYFASNLAKMLGADYVNSDRLRKELFPKRTYSEKEKSKVYDTMLKEMAVAIGQGKNLVLDATFHKNATKELFMEKAKENLFFIEVRADEKIIKERLKKDRPNSEADYEVHKLIRQQWEPLERPHLILQSTNDNIDDMLKKAIKYLNDDTRADR